MTAGELGSGGLDAGIAAARLRAVCAAVAPTGLRVAVEAFPWSGLRDVATARAVVQASGVDLAPGRKVWSPSR